MDSFRILLGGDLFPSKNNVDLFTEGRSDELFDEAIIELFKRADFSICNLEGTLTDSCEPIKKVDPIIKAPKEAIRGYSGLNLSCVTLANNHIADYGAVGFEDTIHVLEQSGIDYFGAGKKADIKKYIEINANHKKVIIYTVAETMFNVPSESMPGVNLYDGFETCDEIRKLRKECDYLVVIYHGGTEFFWYGSRLLRKRFHHMAESGANLVVAQHTHCIGMQEEYKGACLLYGQGDFLFARRESPYREFGLLLELVVSDDGVKVSRHLIKHVDNHVIYDPEQDFTQFDERSHRLHSGDDFDEEYKDFASDGLLKFLEAFRGINRKTDTQKR